MITNNTNSDGVHHLHVADALRLIGLTLLPLQALASTGLKVPCGY